MTKKLTKMSTTCGGIMRELSNVRGTVEKARTAANEGWRSLNEMATGAANGSAQGRWSA